MIFKRKRKRDTDLDSVEYPINIFKKTYFFFFIHSYRREHTFEYTERILT